jgi:hypothetical protein
MSKWLVSSSMARPSEQDYDSSSDPRRAIAGGRRCVPWQAPGCHIILTGPPASLWPAGTRQLVVITRPGARNARVCDPPASPCGHSGARVCGRAGRRPPPSSDKIGEGMHRRGRGPRPTASVLAGACPSVRHQDPGWPPVKLLRLGLRLVKIAAEHSPSGKVTTHV